MKTVICLGGGTEALPIIRKVKELGHRAVVVDGNPNALGFSAIDSRAGDDAVCASCYDAEDVLLAGEMDPGSGEYAGPFDAVLCAACDAPLVAAEVAQKFGLPGLSVEAARLGCDKLAQKEALRAAHLPVPGFSTIDKGVWDIPKGAVVKPVDSRGARGVARFLPGIPLQSIVDAAMDASPTHRIMAEEWLDGPQLSTESIVQDGKVLFTGIGTRNYDRLDEFVPYCIEDGFDSWRILEADSIPAPELLRQVDEVIAAACRALGWYQQGGGTVKGDLVIYNGKVYVIELAARLSGGFFATHGHPLAYGVDFVGAAIRLALGERLDPAEFKAEHKQFVCQRYVFPEPDDIGKTVVSCYGRLPPDEVIFATWNIKRGDVIQPVTSHPNRWGQAICVGATPAEARERACHAVAEMKKGVILR